MNILIVGSEAAPYARTGGLGDVLGALPAALARHGHDVRVFLPHYARTTYGPARFVPLDWSVEARVNGTFRSASVGFIKNRKSNVEYYFVGNDTYFERDSLYTDPDTGSDYKDNDERFTFFCRSTLEAARKLNFRPDIIHVHDWQTALIPALLKTELKSDPFYANVRSVFTIHNMAYQGVFPTDRWDVFGLPNDLMAATGPFEFYDKINLLKSAIVYSDLITTVSPRYAEEIQQSADLGCGLDGVLRSRSADVRGILNGVDYTVWSPSRDKKIPYNYHLSNLSGKRMNRVELLGETNLPIRENAPVLGIISRLVDQKGLDLIAGAADELFDMNIQMILLGTGKDKYHKLFAELERKYPDKLKCYFTFDDKLAHKIEAAADIFLMPSKFEPCGLNQMYSLKYGTVPIVRKVGGLADTVTDYDPQTGEGTGFVFEDYTADALLATVKRAVDLFQKKRKWMKLMKAGMKKDFSWDKSASRYSDLFEEVTKR